MKTIPSFHILPSIILLTISLCFLGCDRTEHTIDRLRKEITEFRTAPDDQINASIEKGLVKLDAHILELRNHKKIDKANLLQEKRNSLAADFGAAKVHRTFQDAQSALKDVQGVIQKTGETENVSSGSPVPATSISPESVLPSGPSSTVAPNPAGSNPASATTPEVATPPPASSPTPQASPTVTPTP